MNEVALLDKKLAQREELDKEIEALKKKQRAERIKTIREDVARFDITAEDIFGTGRARTRKTTKAPIKYRDPATGNTWSGRGREPNWLAGRNREDFLVK